MDTLKIQAMIPSSISEISYANQESDLASIPYHKNNDRSKLADYQIKINGPDFKDNSAIYDEKYERNQRIHSPLQAQQNIMPTPQSVEYKDKISGYQLYRDQFSQDQILKAFNIIDVNKDDVITEDDVMFVLDFIKEQYTRQQVKQMIEMLSSDKKQVSFEDFKKLGKGQVMPLAKFKMPDRNSKDKSRILQNIANTQLINEQPDFLINCIKRESVTYSKFEQVKKGTKKDNSSNQNKSKVPAQDKLFAVVPIRSQSQFRQRRQLFMSIVISNLNDLIHNYQQHKDKLINIQKVSALLQISLKQAKQLYPNVTQIDSLLPIMQSIAYSRVKSSKKLQLCLQVISSKDTININELVHIIQVLKGKDESIEKKLKAILQSKRIKADEPLFKNQAYQIILQFSARLMI